MEAETKKYPLWAHAAANFLIFTVLLGWCGMGLFLGIGILKELGWSALYHFVDPYLQEHFQFVGACRG